jgi:hypothetical protein
MAHTDIGGAVGGNMTYTAGIYHVTSSVTFTTQNCVFDRTAGDIIFAVAAGVNAFGFNGAGSITDVGASSTHRVIITSVNDPLVSAEVGGSGTPARGDYGYAVAITGNSRTIDCSFIEVWYSQSGYGAISWTSGVNLPNDTITLNNVKLRYCGLTANSSLYNSLIGVTNAAGTNVGTVNLNNVSIDSTCVLDANSTYSHGMYWESANVTITNCFIAPTCTTNPRYVLLALPRSTGSMTVLNTFVAGSATTGVLCLAYVTGTSTGTVKNCVVIATGGGVSQGAMVSYYISGTANALHADCVASAPAGKIGYAKVGAHTCALSYCNFYGAGTRSSGSPTDNNPINADPTYGNVPAGCVINSASCVFPNGYAPTAAGFEKNGSQSMSAAGLDASIQTATGKKYASSDLVTVGIQYTVQSFFGVLQAQHHRIQQGN